MYLRGEGVQQNAKVAKIWFERGAEYNEKESLNGLGVIYRDGLAGGKKDSKVAHEYFVAAASQDLAEAQVNLGKYHFGSLSSLLDLLVTSLTPISILHYRPRRIRLRHQIL